MSTCNDEKYCGNAVALIAAVTLVRGLLNMLSRQKMDSGVVQGAGGDEPFRRKTVQGDDLIRVK